MRGQIKTWNEGRGFGFIGPEDGGEDVFVHARDLPEGVISLAKGQMVEWREAPSPDGRPRGRVTSVDSLTSRAPAPQPGPAAVPSAAPDRVAIWTPERRTELADKAVDGLLDANDSPARVDAMRVLLEAIFDDARGA